MGGGGGGCLFNGTFGKLKGPLATEEPPTRKLKGHSRPEKFSLQVVNFRCSENFVPAPTFLLQNKNKNKINQIK